MPDDKIQGISRGEEKLDTGDELGGIRQGQNIVEILEEAIPEGIDIRPEDVLEGEVEPPDGSSEIVQALYKLYFERLRLEEQRIAPVQDKTTTTNKSQAAEINKGAWRQRYAVFFNFDTGTDDLKIEVSLDGNTWRPYASLPISQGGETDVATGRAVFTYIRAFPGSNFNDSNVNLVQIISAGGS